MPKPSRQSGSATRDARSAAIADSQPAVDGDIHYRIVPAAPRAHLFSVECTIRKPATDGEIFALPAWIPGSYLIRDFARHVVALTASTEKGSAAVEKIAKDQWRVKAPAGSRSLTVRYEVYAADLSVRGAFLDATHGFFNGSSVFLRVLGREDLPCVVDIVAPPGEKFKDWQVATALPTAGRTRTLRCGRYRAADYAELIDHPVEMGNFDLVEFRAGGVHHRLTLTGRHDADLDRLARDLKKICAWQIAFWGMPAPVSDYTFLVTAVGDGYGGLEHRASTALICRRDELPRRDAKKGAPGRTAGANGIKPGGADGIGEGYRNFLGLASHEYFHTWLVKRIQPAEFIQPDLQRENPTDLLWLFEGFTAYYDDLSLLRAGLIGEADYLACLARTIAQVKGTPGRSRQSLAAASFDAWIKYYRPDENSPNTTISYYAKGSLFALLLDLTLREATRGRKSLDDLMRRLWREHGMTGKGVREADVRRITEEIAGRTLGAFFRRYVHGTDELPLARALRHHGIDLSFTGGGTPSLGVRLAASKESDEAKIATVFNGGAAEAAGLSAHDVIIALDGLRVSDMPGSLDALLARHTVGDSVTVHAFRRDELFSFRVTLNAAPPTGCRLARSDEASAAARRLRAIWLRQA